MANKSINEAKAGLFYNEPKVARYLTVTEPGGWFTIPDSQGVNDRHIENINAPGLTSGSGSLPVIFFRTVHSGNPLFSVRLNDSLLIEHTFEEAGPHSWHALIPDGALLSENNELTFYVNVDNQPDKSKWGVTFVDIFILYTSNELTVRQPLVISPPKPL